MWDHTLRFSVAPLEELRFWYNNIDSFKGYSLWQLVSLVLLGRHNGLRYVQVWRPWSELHVLRVENYLLSSLSFEKQLWQKRVNVFTNNRGAERKDCWQFQSPPPVSCYEYFLVLCFKWDHPWSTVDFQVAEWELWSPWPIHWRGQLETVFCLPDAKWGPHTFDCCATYYNAQLPSLNWSLPLLDSVGSTTLAQDWSAENNWMCAPVSIIVDSVCYLISCFGYRTLIIPKWPST